MRPNYWSPPSATALLRWAVLLCLTTMVAALEYAAMEERELLPNGGVGWEPRSAIEASPASPLFARDTVNCGDGQHSCLDVGPLGASLCCPNNYYCILSPQWVPKCCPFGSNCESLCNDTQIYCNATATATVSSSTTRSGSAVLTAVVTTSLQPACCPRPCTASVQFLCDSQFGGGCCSLGQTCASNKQCLVPATPTTTALFTAAPSGCTTGQVTCASSLGGGCCSSNQICTQINSGAYCAPGGNVTVVDNSDSGGGGLSTGAKAGIAVGVVIAAAIVIGALTWFCLRQRRRSRLSSLYRSAQGAPREPTQNQVVSETSGPSNRRGLTYDYFGPDAVAGPFTTRDHEGANMSAASLSRGVPLTPRDPGDIVAPVELETLSKKEGDRTPVTTVTSLAEGGEREQVHVPEHTNGVLAEDVESPAQDGPYELQDGPFELAAPDLGTPSPIPHASPSDEDPSPVLGRH